MKRSNLVFLNLRSKNIKKFEDIYVYLNTPFECIEKVKNTFNFYIL